MLLVGIVSQRWRSCYPGARCDLELILVANNMTLTNARKANIEVDVLADASEESEPHIGSSLPVFPQTRIAMGL